MKRSSLRSRFGMVLVALVFAGVAGGIAAPARADDDHRRGERDRDFHDRDRHDRDRRDHDDGRFFDRPGDAYVYAPPGVVYATPYPPPTSFFGFNVNIR